jgi:two-component system cell cycle response regulator
LGEKLGERESQFEKVTELATKDGLTGVFNHRYFSTHLAERFEKAKQTGEPLSLILIDIDNYKEFNDRYGHQQGDLVIQQLAHLLVNLTRRSDLVARYGGDEFAVLLSRTDRELALQIAERIRVAFEQKPLSRFRGEGHLTGTCSVGVATYVGNNFATPQDLIQQSDTALYQAKRNGRNQVFCEL